MVALQSLHPVLIGLWIRKPERYSFGRIAGPKAERQVYEATRQHHLPRVGKMIVGGRARAIAQDLIGTHVPREAAK